MRLLPFASILSSALAVMLTPQSPFFPADGDSAFVQHASLSSAGINRDGYTVLSHPAFPEHRVRIKETTGFCDPGVKSYGGYIDVADGKHLWFYFFESRSNPETDPVVLWTNGGGASSTMGLFMELGPCNIDVHPTSGSNGTVYNPYSWTEAANIFFIDQPVSVGYSYAEHGQVVRGTEQAAVDVAAFVQIFFASSKTSPVESSTCRESPSVDDTFRSLRPRSSTRMRWPGSTACQRSTSNQCWWPSLYDMSCTGASIAPVLSIKECVRIQQLLPRFKIELDKHCGDYWDQVSCAATYVWVFSELFNPYDAKYLNHYDISNPPNTTGFYVDESLAIFTLLNRRDVREFLGVDPSSVGFAGSSWQVSRDFQRTLDFYKPSHFNVAALLERGVPMLFYVGTYDWICNWVGNSRWLETLEWTGKEGYNAAETRNWTVDGTVAGQTKSFRNLRFATVYGAGHLVPHDRPAESLALFKRWIGGKAL